MLTFTAQQFARIEQRSALAFIERLVGLMRAGFPKQLDRQPPFARMTMVGNGLQVADGYGFEAQGLGVGGLQDGFRRRPGTPSSAAPTCAPGSSRGASSSSRHESHSACATHSRRWSTCAGSAASFGKGLASGVGEGAVSMDEGLWSLGKGAVNVGSRLATDSAYRQAAAEQTRALANGAVEYGSRLIDDPATRTQAYEQVQNLAGSLKQQFLEARAQAEREGKLAEFYGRVAGRGGFEVATFVVPAAKLSALGKAGDLSKAAEAADLAKSVKTTHTLTSVKAGHAVQECAATANRFIVLVNGSERLAGAQHAIIDARKLTEYALNPLHPKGGNKARVFESAFGFNKGSAQDLLAQLRDGVIKVNPTVGKVDDFGSRFTLDIPVIGPKGAGIVRSGWIYKAGSEMPELTTLFVK